MEAMKHGGPLSKKFWVNLSQLKDCQYAHGEHDLQPRPLADLLGKDGFDWLSTVMFWLCFFLFDPENHQNPFQIHRFPDFYHAFVKNPRAFAVSWVQPRRAQNHLTAPGPQRPIARNSGSFGKSWCGSSVPWSPWPMWCPRSVGYWFTSQPKPP